MLRNDWYNIDVSANSFAFKLWTQSQLIYNEITAISAIMSTAIINV